MTYEYGKNNEKNIRKQNEIVMRIRQIVITFGFVIYAQSEKKIDFFFFPSCVFQTC